MGGRGLQGLVFQTSREKTSPTAGIGEERTVRRTRQGTHSAALKGARLEGVVAEKLALVLSLKKGAGR